MNLNPWICECFDAIVTYLKLCAIPFRCHGNQRSSYIKVEGSQGKLMTLRISDHCGRQRGDRCMLDVVVDAQPTGQTFAQIFAYIETFLKRGVLMT